eukprot:1038152-Amphidinium_carterae.1
MASLLFRLAGDNRLGQLGGQARAGDMKRYAHWIPRVQWSLSSPGLSEPITRTQIALQDRRCEALYGSLFKPCW